MFPTAIRRYQVYRQPEHNTPRLADGSAIKKAARRLSAMRAATGGTPIPHGAALDRWRRKMDEQSGDNDRRRKSSSEREDLYPYLCKLSLAGLILGRRGRSLGSGFHRSQERMGRCAESRGWAPILSGDLRRLRVQPTDTHLRTARISGDGERVEASRQSIDMRMTTPPITSPALISVRGDSLWLLWHMTQALAQQDKLFAEGQHGIPG